MAQRQFTIGQRFAREKAGEGDQVVDMAFASQEPYQRWWGIEVLQMGGARLDRLNDGAPLLYNHDWGDLRGTHIPGSVRADSDGVLRGQVRITAATQAGRDTIGLVESGVLTKASIGYTIDKIVQQSTTKNAAGETVKVERVLDGAAFERLLQTHSVTRDGRSHPGDLQAFRRGLDELAGAPIQRDAESDAPDVFLVVDFQPYESSLVTIPADNGVGVGRSAAHVPVPAAPAAVPTPSNLSEKTTMYVKTHRPQEQATDGTAGSAGAAASAYAGIDHIELERQRRRAIEDTVKANRLDARLAGKWIEDGVPLHEVAGKVLELMEERGRAKPVAASALGLSNKETQSYSLFRAIRAMKFGASNPSFVQEAGFEMECSRAVAKQLGRELTTSILLPGEVLQRPLGRQVAERAMATSSGSKGGYMVNVENMGFIDILRNRSVAMAMGARTINGLVGNAMFPRQTGKASVTWQGGEGATITASDQTLGQLSMTPKTAIAITDVSEQLLRQATPSAEAFVMADLARDIAIDGVDNAVINGTGGAQPLGIKNTTGITSGQDASSATYAKILAFVSTAGALNAIRGNPGFVTTTAGAARLMQVQRFTSTDTPLWTGNMLDGQLVGFNAMSSEQLSSGNLIFGSWDEVVIGDWGVLELAMDNGGTRFNNAQVGLRAMWMVDVLVRYPTSFVVGTNLS